MQTSGAPIMGRPNKGSSAIIGPDGRMLSAAETENEQLVIGDLDLSLVTKNKTFADASGHCEYPCSTNCSSDHYTDSRPDLLWLGADPMKKNVVRAP